MKLILLLNTQSCQVRNRGQTIYLSKPPKNLVRLKNVKLFNLNTYLIKVATKKFQVLNYFIEKFFFCC